VEYRKSARVSMNAHAEFNEKWLQQQIASDVTLLSLGDLDAKDIERRQPGFGRLDMLPFDPESSTRYEVEIQLGATDESHIIRTLEYWDNERRRFPQYEHIAVIVAEEITGRFLNVINLFNQAIPLIAIQMSALEVDGMLTLHATRVLDLAENATHTLHNLLPLRGTEVRDAKGWSHFIGEALEEFGSDAQVLVAQHHWPVWGNEQVTRALRQQRDLYKFVHDQSVRMMNQGYTPADIADALTLPPSLAKEWSARGYYGTLQHNSKAVYQKYIGWFDGNPSNLNPLPPAEAGKKFVEYMGGAAAVIARARDDFTQGNYRWVAQVMNQVVFADPGNTDARALAADALEQMGYLAESATWRNAYLLGAQELRGGSPAPRRSSVDPDMLHAMPIDWVFDMLGTRVNGARAQATRIVVNWRFTDTGQRLASTLEDAALTYVVGKEARDADVSVTLTRAALEAMLLGRQTLAAALQQGIVATTGNAGKLTELTSLLDDFDASFPVVEPRSRQ